MRHLIADLDPLQVKEPKMHPELDPRPTGSPSGISIAKFLTGSDSGIYAQVGGQNRMPLGDLLGVLRDAHCRTVGVEYMHIQDPVEKRWMQEQLEGADRSIEPDEQRHILDGSTPLRRWRPSSARSTSARSASVSKAPNPRSRWSMPCSAQQPTPAWPRP